MDSPGKNAGVGWHALFQGAETGDGGKGAGHPNHPNPAQTATGRLVNSLPVPNVTSLGDKSDASNSTNPQR